MEEIRFQSRKIRPATHWRCCHCQFKWLWALYVSCINCGHVRDARCVAIVVPAHEGGIFKASRPIALEKPRIAPETRRAEVLAIRNTQDSSVDSKSVSDEPGESVSLAHRIDRDLNHRRGPARSHLPSTSLQSIHHLSNKDKSQDRSSNKVPENDGHSRSLTRYRAEIQNIARSLVYSWLERKRGSYQDARTQQPPIHSLTNGSDEGNQRNDAQSCDRSPEHGKRTKKSNQKSLKRPGGENNEDGEEDMDENAHNNRRQRLDNSDEHLGKIWACPYWKHDPIMYSPQNNCKCSTHMLNNISRLKQHLDRAHLPPAFYCRRCFTIFRTEDALVAHDGQAISCQPASSLFDSRITVAQKKAVRKKTPKKTPWECWYHIYAILFPGDTLPDSPCEASPIQVVVNELSQFIRVEAHPRMSERIRAGLLQLYPPDPTREASINDIVEEAVSHFSDLVAARAFRRGNPRPLNPPDGYDSMTPALTDGHTEATRALSSPTTPSHRLILEAATQQTGDIEPHPDGSYDMYTNMPGQDDEFLDFLDFDPVPKTGDNCDGSFPSSWAVDP